MASARRCKNSADMFCYVCGEYCGKSSEKRAIEPNSKFCDAYEVYFGVAVGDLDKDWAPHVVCNSCRLTLEGKTL